MIGDRKNREIVPWFGIKSKRFYVSQVKNFLYHKQWRGGGGEELMLFFCKLWSASILGKIWFPLHGMAAQNKPIYTENQNVIEILREKNLFSV